MNAPSSHPQMTLLRERVNDLAACLEVWDQRSATADKAAARAAGNQALERINAIANQLSDLGVQLVAELRAFDNEGGCLGDGICTNPRCRRHGVPWTDTGTGPGWPAGDPEPPQGT